MRAKQILRLFENEIEEVRKDRKTITLSFVDIKAEDWEKLLEKIGAPLNPQKLTGERKWRGRLWTGWLWEGDRVVIVATNDPVTGKNLIRPEEVVKDYLGEVVVEGDADIVNMIVKMFDRYGKYLHKFEGIRGE